VRVPDVHAAEESTPEQTFALGGESAPIGEEDCSAFIPPERTGGDLVVRNPPERSTRSFLGRLRSHTEGSLSRGSQRVWVGPPVPGFVPLTDNTAELTLLDATPGGEFLAMYRDPYGASSCTLDDLNNCRFTVKLFGDCGELRWSVALNDFMSRQTYLEMQDVHLHDGTLYFNESCQSYSRKVKGRCSALVAVDPASNKLLWRSKHLVSNGRFLVHGDYIISGYGFTAEPDAVYLVRRDDGKVLQRVSVPKAPEDFKLVGDDVVEATLYPGDVRRRFHLTGRNGPRPRLVPAS
jgi:hypothetical protein